MDAKFGTALVAAAALVIVSLIGGCFTIANTILARNNRTSANAEADLLAKLDPESASAKELTQLIEARIHGWHRRAFKKWPNGALDPSSGVSSDVLETLIPRLGLVVSGAVFLYVILRQFL